MADLGIDLYRFSFNWTRVMGDGDQPNQEGIDFYNRLIDGCLEKESHLFLPSIILKCRKHW